MSSIGGVGGNYSGNYLIQRFGPSSYYDRFYKSPLQNSGLGSISKPSFSNTQATGFLSKIQEGAMSLSGALSGMTGPSTFEKFTASSSDAKSVFINAGSTPTGKFGETQISVSQIATGQINRGAEMDGKAASHGLSGMQRFELDVNGRKATIQIEIKDGDLNSDIQKKMASAINSANIGLTARLDADSESGNGALVIEAAATGDNPHSSFGIRDLGEGSLVSLLGADLIQQTGQNAVYTVNGREKTSSTNNIDLGEGVRATLLKVTEDPVTISAAEDKQFAANKLNEIVKNYNKLLEDSRGGYNGNTRLFDDLTNTMRSYMPSLQSLGISMGKDGALSVDSGKLSEAAENGKLKSVFSPYHNSNYGLTNRLTNITNNVQRSPVSYINRDRDTFRISNVINPSEEDFAGLKDYTNFNSARYAGYMNAYNMIGMFMNLYA